MPIPKPKAGDDARIDDAKVRAALALADGRLANDRKFKSAEDAAFSALDAKPITQPGK